MTASTETRWWEGYLVRYLMPSIASAAIILWMASASPEAAAILLLPKTVDQLQAPELILLLLYANSCVPLIESSGTDEHLSGRRKRLDTIRGIDFRASRCSFSRMGCGLRLGILGGIRSGWTILDSADCPANRFIQVQ